MQKLHEIRSEVRKNRPLIHCITNPISINQCANGILAVGARPMMAEIYGQLLEDLQLGKKNSPIFRHHIDYVNQFSYPRDTPYEKEEPNQLIVDYIASMTDDYLIDLHHFLFPDSDLHVDYTGYFIDLQG